LASSFISEPLSRGTAYNKDLVVVFIVTFYARMDQKVLPLALRHDHTTPNDTLEGELEGENRRSFLRRYRSWKREGEEELSIQLELRRPARDNLHVTGKIKPRTLTVRVKISVTRALPAEHCSTWAFVGITIKFATFDYKIAS